MSDYTFDDLVIACMAAGEPFHIVGSKRGGGYQASLKSKYSKGSHDAFTCASGATATDALENVMRQRQIPFPNGTAIDEEDDPLS
jgi:hypothetical protein